MARSIQSVSLAIVLTLGSALAQDPPPLDVGVEESTEVNLVLVDTVVIDEEGRTVPDLQLEDFELSFRGEVLAIDTLDIACDAGALDDPGPVRRANRREVVPSGSEPRRIVIAFDYMHLSPTGRNDAFDQARQLIGSGLTAGDEVMLVALTGGVRIEHPFATDADEVLRSLRRMDHDVTLWNGVFTHQTERGFVGGMTGLFDVLGTVRGRKSVVLFSEMEDVPLDLEFDRLSAAASASRCSVYSVDVRGLVPPNTGVHVAPG